MGDHDAELRKRLKEMDDRFRQHERFVVRIMAGVVVLGAVVLLLLIGPLLSE